MNLFDIENKVILITGGGGVLGGEMSNYLLSNGATVIVLDRREETVNAALEKLKKLVPMCLVMYVMY
ncbi:SDR family NAD(P)-dependent oxidoreductase [Cellulophaga baltica 4]|nr:SDR family NAD(P)-dependent oxidoreductase [Cellulophaga baltica 4]